MSVDEAKNIGDENADLKTDQGWHSLDAEIAERVMGWRIAEHPERHGTGQWMSEYAYPVYYKSNGQYVESCLFQPEIEIADAFQVIEAMQERGFRVFIRDYEGVVTWEVTFMSHVSGTASGNELPDVICRAALKATECLSLSARPDDGPAS